MPSSRKSSRPRNRTHVSYISCIGRRVLYHLGSPFKGVKSVVQTFIELLFANCRNNSQCPKHAHSFSFLQQHYDTGLTHHHPLLQVRIQRGCQPHVAHKDLAQVRSSASKAM